LVIVALIFGIGSSALLFAQSRKEGFKMATVNVQEIVAASPQVAALKAEEAIKIQELQIFVQQAQKEAAEEKNESKKKEIVSKYEREILLKKNEIEKDYANKLKAIDKDITAIIGRVAEKNGMNAVIAKTNVIYGGTDITKEVVAEFK